MFVIKWKLLKNWDINSHNIYIYIILYNAEYTLENDIYIFIYFQTLHIYIYIYTYIFLKKKTKTGYFRIINLFPSGFSVSGVNQKHEEKYNRTSSDPMDK